MRAGAVALRAGLAAAAGQPRLVLLAWCLNLAVAAAFSLPGALALRARLGPLPEADVLAHGFVLGAVVDLAELQPGLLRGLGLAALGAALLGWLSGAAVSGGLLEVLTTRDQRPVWHRFGRGAGRFFGRFLRASLLTALGATVLAALLGAPLMAWASRLRRESPLETLALLASLAAPLVVGLVLLLALLGLDAARVRIVREDARRVWPALRWGLLLVLRHPLAWLSAWAVNLALLLLALAVYLALSGLLPGGSAAGIVALFTLQQAFVLARCWLRVALLGSEQALVERWLVAL